MAGQVATMITGNWISGGIAAEDAANFGFFFTPPETAGAAKPSVRGTSSSYPLGNGSPNTELAVEHIDWLLSDRATQLWTEAQIVSVGVDPNAAEPGTLFGDLVGARGRLDETDAVGHDLDRATPTFSDTLIAALRELPAGQTGRAGFVQRVEQDYQGPRPPGLDDWARPWLGDFDVALPAVGMIATWVGCGFAMFLFIAGVQRIEEDIFDAAKLDGAGAW